MNKSTFIFTWSWQISAFWTQKLHTHTHTNDSTFFVSFLSFSFDASLPWHASWRDAAVTTCTPERAEGARGSIHNRSHKWSGQSKLRSEQRQQADINTLSAFSAVAATDAAMHLLRTTRKNECHCSDGRRFVPALPKGTEENKTTENLRLPIIKPYLFGKTEPLWIN